MSEQTDPLCLSRTAAAELLAAAPWRRWGIIGDSLSLGVGDPVDGYRPEPWHTRVARALRSDRRDVEVFVQGAIGATTAMTLRDQLPALRAFDPDLVHVPSAANDIWCRTPDFAAIERELRLLLGSIREWGATVTIFTLGSAFDVVSIKDFRERVLRLNDVIRVVARQHGALVIEMANHPVMGRTDLLSADGVHFSSMGQAVMAAEVEAAQLRPEGVGVTSTPRSRRQGAASVAGWAPGAAALVTAGWCANQFVPLLVAYTALGVAPGALHLAYAAYALGLVPSLPVAGRASDRLGRRPVLLAGHVTVFVATLVTALAGTVVPALLLGRALTGVGCGVLLATGAAWVRDSSAASGAADRSSSRIVGSATVGFAVGPLLSGTIATSTTSLALPYVFTCLVVLPAAAVAALRSPGPRREVPSPVGESISAADGAQRTTSALQRGTVRLALTFAPWVFAGPATYLAVVVPAATSRSMGDPTLVSAWAACVGALAGLSAPLLLRVLPGRGVRPLVAGATAFVAAGFVADAVVIARPTLAGLLLASLLVGAAYGTANIAGFTFLAKVNPEGPTGLQLGVYQSCTYLGFAVPPALDLGRHVQNMTASSILLALAGIAVVSGTAPLLRHRHVDSPSERDSMR